MKSQISMSEVSNYHETNLPSESSLSCSKEERRKGWNLRATFDFFERGIVQEVTFLGGEANVTATKYYERLFRQEDIEAESKG